MTAYYVCQENTAEIEDYQFHQDFVHVDTIVVLDHQLQLLMTVIHSM